MTRTERYCVKCKADREVDGISFRCLTCGTQTKFVGAASDVSPLPTGTVLTPVLTLPSNPASRRWMERTKALADGFRQSAEAARGRAKAAADEANRLARVAKAYEDLLQQIALESPSLDTSESKRWARQYDACAECGKTDSPHSGHGKCARCAMRQRKAVA